MTLLNSQLNHNLELTGDGGGGGGGIHDTDQRNI